MGIQKTKGLNINERKYNTSALILVIMSRRLTEVIPLRDEAYMSLRLHLLDRESQIYHDVYFYMKKSRQNERPQLLCRIARNFWITQEAINCRVWVDRGLTVEEQIEGVSWEESGTCHMGCNMIDCFREMFN